MQHLDGLEQSVKQIVGDCPISVFGVVSDCISKVASIALISFG